MTDEEATEFVQHASTAFPGLLELLEKSPGTLGVWAKTLQQVAFREALRVLERWIAGSLPDPPVGFRRELFALDVRQVVLNDRAVANRFVSSKRAMDNGRKYPSAAFVSIAKPFGEILDLRAKVMAGELSGEECDRRVDEVIDNAFAGSAR